MSSENSKEVASSRMEQEPADEVSSEFLVVDVAREMEIAIEQIENLPIKVSLMLQQMAKSMRGYKQFGKELFVALEQKGIECLEDLNDYFVTTERDGELVADICDMFQTNVREVRTVLAEVRDQIRTPRAARTLEEDRMDIDRDGGKNDEHVGTTDWSTLRTALETAFGDLGGTKQHGTSVREQGFDAVVEELRRLLSSDSTAGRLRALTELRNLKRWKGQSVAEFCVALEKLGRQANPACSIADRSLEYAQILLDNLADWPEHVHLLSTLHRVDAKEAYESVKQLALSIEQSKAMWSTEASKGREERDSWRKRAIGYQGGNRMDVRHEKGTAEITGPAKWEVRKEGSVTLGRPGNHMSGNTSGHRVAIDRSKEGTSRRDVNGQRRCYNCQKDCPAGKG
ncbi:unnamed protein product [Nippostrongylus brasiliensis]|uniref:CCHC-type domain-containing protein n=1 Tax=Nippostrongylus brasiliensis TaxID=27835 RepID=A0A0N4YYS4_NIPBR|nr:unnamed protein product [Nippostrongylus brasiliensis]